MKCFFILVIALVELVAGVSILMQNVDMQRTGWNPYETTLNAANVPKLRLLGKIKTVTPCSTQMLYYENLNLQGHKNVLFCWTNADRSGTGSSAYAFDADTLQTIWTTNIGPSAIWTTQAPAIDPATNFMYFIYKANDINGYNYIIGIDIMTGKQLPDSPKFINGTVPGTGDASVNGQLAFQNTDGAPGGTLHSDSRTSMLIVKSVLYFAFGRNPDTKPYHGWVFSYRYDTSARQFVQLAKFCVTPNGGEGGIWQGAQGLVSDGNSVYFTTGNGDFNPKNNDYGMGALKLSLQLEFQDYFVPTKWAQYSQRDEDMTSCGPALIPNTNFLIVGVTKYGGIHLINKTNMGKFDAQTDACHQTISLSSSIVFAGGNPCVWDRGNNQGARTYFWPPDLNAIFQFDYDPISQTLKTPGPKWTQVGSTFGGLFVSSNGNNNPILWGYGGDGMVYAFDASKNIDAGPIWQQRTSIPPSWSWPLVVNGKLYIPGGDSNVWVFGQ